MASTQHTGSFAAGTEFTTAAVTNSNFQDFTQEVTDLLASGWEPIGGPVSDGTDWAIMMKKKKW